MRSNFKAKVAEITGRRTNDAIHAILSQGAATAATMTPVDTGNLINSQYRPQIEQRDGKTVGHVGYTANYAGFVHDAPGKLKGVQRPGNRGNYWNPAGEPQFLKKGFDRIKPKIPALLKAAYQK